MIACRVKAHAHESLIDFDTGEVIDTSNINFMMLDLFGLYRQGILPQTGGVFDQSGKFFDAMSVCADTQREMNA